MTRTFFLSTLFVLGACSTEAPDSNVFGDVQADPQLEMERGAAVHGQLTLDDGSVVQFASSPKGDGQYLVEVVLNGMLLTADLGPQGHELHGVSAETGKPTLMTHEDRTQLLRLVSAMEAEFYPPITHVTSKRQYDELRGMSEAEWYLFQSIEGLWSQWPTSMPLFREGEAVTERAYSSWRRWTDEGYYRGTHDCWDCDYNQSDCSDYKRLGREFDGANHGNCGTSSSGSQFTYDCTNHDQCVRTSKHGGHSLASAWCNDDFTYCIDDEVSAPDCDYDWRGSSIELACPSSWIGTNDGCDCFCGVQDPDCSV